MMAGSVLATAGYRDINFGPETPLELLAAAAAEHKASIVWLSIKVVVDRAKLRRQIDELSDRLEAQGTRLVIGGGGVESLAIRATHHLHLMQTMTELAAFAGSVGVTGVSNPPPATRRDHGEVIWRRSLT